MQVLFQFANALGDPIEANPLGQQPPWAMNDAPYPINPGERGPITVLVCEVPEPPPFALAYGDGTATGTLTVAVNPSSPVPANLFLIERLNPLPFVVPGNATAYNLCVVSAGTTISAKIVTYSAIHAN